MNRADSLSRLRHDEEYDLCIIGGGISGVGAALDARLRGWRVCLVEREDFASGTSSKSTKLIHGGVRYLESAFMHMDFGQLRQVKHGLRERSFLLRNAPHLASPLELMTPVFSRWQGIYYTIGMHLYRWFAGSRDTLPKSRWLDKAATFRLMPHLNHNIQGAVIYYDGQLDDARYALSVAIAAADEGVCLGNYLQLEGFASDEQGKLQAAKVRCTLTNEQFAIRAKVFLNCTGPFSDAVRTMANPLLKPRISASKGVHLMMPLPQAHMKEALLIPKTPDGRVLFAIPFGEKLIVGTTDTPYTDIAQEPMLLTEEVDFILETLAPYYEKMPEKSTITGGFGGLRPLVRPSEDDLPRTTKSMLRDHEVEQDTRSGLLSLLGGKWTTYRLMAKDAVDAVEHNLGVAHPCRTENYLLPGAADWNSENFKHLQEKYGIGLSLAKHLNSTYGTNSAKVLELTLENRELLEPLVDHYPYIKGEVIYQVRYEMAQQLRDVLARRLRLEILDWKVCRLAVPEVADLMAKELGWSQESTQNGVDAYLKLIDRFMAKASIFSLEKH